MKARSMLSDMFARDEWRAAGMLLSEGYDYRRMADPILSIARRLYGADDRKVQEMRTLIESDITAARVTLRRYDRVIWFLRMWRIGCASRFLWNEAPEAVTKMATALSRQSGMSVDAVFEEGRKLEIDSRRILRDLQHLFSLPIPAIQNMRFQDTYSVLAGMDEMQKAERAWQAEVKDSFEPDENDKPLIRFKDGLAWWLLDREHCGVEGKAMGHCGNSAAWQYGDRLLSLRQSFTVGGRLRVKPYLTFILRDGDVLGEMKGRFNQKPVRAYEAGHAPSDFHDEIVTLLRHPMVKGIKGGGHAPQENFALTDLDDHIRDDLLKEKPELGGVSYIISKHGAASKEGREAIRDYLISTNLDTPSYLELDGENYVIQEWSNLESFCEDEGDEAVSFLFSILEMDTDDLMNNGFISESALDPETIYDILEYMPDEALEALANDLTLPFASANESGFHRMLRRMADEIVKSEWADDLYDVLTQSIGGNTLRDAVKARIKRYIDVGWYFEFYAGWLEVPKSGDEYDLEAPVRMLVRAEDLAEAVENDQEDVDSGSGNDLHGVRANVRDHGEHAWTAVSWTNTDERRGPYGEKLTDRIGKDLMFDKAASEIDPEPDQRTVANAMAKMTKVPREDVEHRQAAYLLARRLLGHDGRA